MPFDGEMEQPLFGELGVLEDNGERARCHLCGGFYGNLGGHVRQIHGVAPRDYKARFGLKVTTGLLGPALKERRRAQAAARVGGSSFAAFREAGRRALAALPAERRSPRGRRARLEERRDPARRAANRANLARANEVLAARREAGTHREPGFTGRDPRVVSARGQARLAELRADPAWRAEWVRKVSAGRGGRLRVTCVVCGTTFAEPQSKRDRQTCGPVCLGEHVRRRNAAAREQVRRSPLGPALRLRRRERGLSQEKLALLAGVSASYVSLLERGRHAPSAAVLGRLAAALGVAPDLLATQDREADEAATERVAA